MVNLLRISLIIVLVLNYEILAQQTLKGRFGFGFGYKSGIEFADFSEVNKTFLKQDEKGLQDNLIIKGFTAYFYFLFLPDTRITFNFLTGDKDIQVSSTKFLNYEKSYWSFGLEYTFSIGHLNISPGFSIGKTTDFIELITFDGNINYLKIIDDYNSKIFKSNSINFSNNSYHFIPVINLEYSLSRFSALCLKYSYQIRLNDDWKFLRKFAVENFPENLVSNNHSLSLGFLIGFMSK